MKKELILAALFFVMAGCGGKKDNPKPVMNPGTVALSLPAQNSVCITGTVLSATESTVSFSWDASANTNSYDLVIKNLLTAATTTTNTTQTQLAVTLSRNTPYSWYVVSKSAQTSNTGQSDTWEFYNAGPGVVNYAPFPAEIIAPVSGNTVSAINGSVTLTWDGTSVDQYSISSYDVYFGTSTTPSLLQSGLTTSTLNVQVTPGTTYYWKVITKDTNGDASDSGVVNFTVK